MRASSRSCTRLLCGDEWVVGDACTASYGRQLRWSADVW